MPVPPVSAHAVRRDAGRSLCVQGLERGACANTKPPAQTHGHAQEPAHSIVVLQILATSCVSVR
eukprot:16641-Alexandrium_andersonii.AAC.1